MINNNIDKEAKQLAAEIIMMCREFVGYKDHNNKRKIRMIISIGYVVTYILASYIKKESHREVIDDIFNTYVLEGLDKCEEKINS